MLKKDTEIEKEALFNLLNLEKLPEKQLKSVSKSLTNIPTQKKTHKLKSPSDLSSHPPISKPILIKKTQFPKKRASKSTKSKDITVYVRHTGGMLW